MKRILITLLIAGALTEAHAQSAKDEAIAYNDRIALTTDSLYWYGTNWGNSFRDIYNGDKDFTKLKIRRDEMLQFISRERLVIQRLKEFGESAGTLKKAMLDFLNFEEGLVKASFVPMEKLSAQSTNEEVEKAATFLQNEAKKEEEELKKVQHAQEYYAARNHLQIEAAEK